MTLIPEFIPPFEFWQFQPDMGTAEGYSEGWNSLRHNSIQVQKLINDARYNCFYEVINNNDPRLRSNDVKSNRVIFQNDKLHPVWRVAELVKWVALSVLTILFLPLLLIDFFKEKELCNTFYTQHKFKFESVIKGKETRIFEMPYKHGRAHQIHYDKLSEKSKEAILALQSPKIMILGHLLCHAFHDGYNQKHPFTSKGKCITEKAVTNKNAL